MRCDVVCDADPLIDGFAHDLEDSWAMGAERNGWQVGYRIVIAHKAEALYFLA